ncbi:MAG TPA: MMPL family transporter [Conexibacter sp.]|nr:MMPL family transporter [Conexibacter sp.]
MRRLARFATRRPGPVLAVWAIAFAVGLVFASGARDHLQATDLQIPGTASARAAKLTRDEFGGTVAMAILLKGPPRIVEARGPGIVTALEHIDGVQVLSPWAIGGARVLREPRGQAMLTLQVKRPVQDIIDKTTPEVQRVLDRVVPPSMTTEVTGLGPLVRAINQASLDSLDQGERIAIPILFFMLLLIFRSPLAALVPALAGLLVTRIGAALMGVVAQHVNIDALALNMLTMIGLALGVDYSLLIVSRFREELEQGRSVPEAVEEVVARAGRTVLFAGTALSAGMLGALAIAPGALLVSASAGVLVATLLSMIVALFAMPAGLALLGTNVNRWQFGGARSGSPWVRIAERALRRPAAAAFFTLLPLLILSLPALALNTGPPNVKNLPADNAARKSYEAFERDRGVGFATPYEVDFSTQGPITTAARLQALQSFQQRASTLPGVDSVIGPASLSDRAEVLRRITRQALQATGPLARLERGLRRTASGTGQLHTGIAAGAAGATALAQGLDTAAQGSSQLAGGVHQAAPQTQRLAQGVARTGQGAAQIASALHRIAPGVARLQSNLDTLRDSLVEQDRNSSSQLVNPLDRAQSSVQAALRALGSASAAAKADPNVQRAQTEVTDALTRLGTVALNLSDFTSTLAANSVASRAIAQGMARLRSGLDRLDGGSRQLADEIAQTAAGASQLAKGVDQLDGGTSALDSGLRQLLDGPHGNDGARALATGLDQAAAGTRRLTRGQQTILDGVVRVRRQGERQQAQLRRNGTDIDRAVDSGYFVLAAIEGAQRQTRTNVSFAMNLERGGGTARVIVVPHTGPFDRGGADLRHGLERDASTAAHAMGAQAVVGGPAVLLDDFDSATTARFPFLVIMLLAVTFLVLLVLFRRPLLALCAVILNLVTVGASVGVLVICFGGDSPLLGGPGYLDAISLSGIFAVIFGLSIDYEVFLISRLLEGRELTGTTEGAIRYGLEKTGTIITGAAFIMAGVFLAFAGSPVTNIRQFGIGLTVAVLLDATVVRLILLPALIRLFGERTWHVPAWLDRRLPHFSAH